VAAVFLGGSVGGYLRYAVTDAWPAPAGRFPWSTFAVNTAGAFILTVVIVIAAEVAPSRYLRPLLGTGFCGALTTFSSVVVAADRLFAHHQSALAMTYLLSSMLAALGAGSFGLVIGRAVAVNRRRTQEEESSP
jgi:CrcB protein